jgi:hypothetical protein
MLGGIGLMLASGVLLVVFATWLRSAANRLAQTAGVLLASVGVLHAPRDWRISRALSLHDSGSLPAW